MERLVRLSEQCVESGLKQSNAGMIGPSLSVWTYITVVQLWVKSSLSCEGMYR